MSPPEYTALAGAAAGRVAIVAIGPAADAIAQLMAKYEPFDFAITSIGVGGNVAEHIAAGVRPQSDTSVSTPSGILVIGDTAHAELTTHAVRALAADREPNARLRIWPVFVNGDPTKLSEFDATLDELPDANCDAVLMLTHVPNPEQAARALLAWLTVKLPAPASVLGQMPDAAGRICRYVALGCELLPAPFDADTVGSGVADGEAGDEAAELELDSVALSRRLGAAAGSLPAIVVLRERRAALDAAMQAAELTAVIEAHQQLVRAGDVEVRAQLELLATDLAAAAMLAHETGREGDADSEPRTSDRDDPVQATADSAEGSTLSFAAALAEYVIVAGKTGFGRMVSGGRRRLATANLAASADAFVTGVEQEWIIQGEQVLHCAVLAAADQARLAAAEAATTESAARTTAAGASWREQLESAVATGRTWQGVDPSRVVRSWGAGAAAPRRYVIGSGELLDTVIDLTDGAEPCLRVITPTDGAAVTVLTAQYGLPLSALS